MDMDKLGKVSVISSASAACLKIVCTPPADKQKEYVDRQVRLPWWNQASYSNSRIAAFGLGVGSRVLEMTLRKGIGATDLCDWDVVEHSNLHRQYYFPEDVGQRKAFALARNLKRIAVYPTVIRAFPMRAEEYLRRHPNDFDVAVCVVDDEDSRSAVGKACHKVGKPCVFGAASMDGDSCRIVVQEPSSACYMCMGGFGGAEVCPTLPAIADIQGVLASTIVYAVDTLLINRPRHWNLRQFFLSGDDFHQFAGRNPDCPVCGKRA